MSRRRLRSLGFTFGDFPIGQTNTIGDVPGVRVGHASVRFGKGILIPGKGPACTGVTVILPHARNLFRDKVIAAVHTINGYGKVVGFEQVRELGLIEAPIALTNTLNIGKVLDALVEYAIRQTPEIGVLSSIGSVNILVGETNDSYLNDIQGRHVGAEHVWSAIETAAGGEVPQGSIGAGTGTVCFGWKGGIGTASRRIHTPRGIHLVGALVQTNFGGSRDLVVLGVPVGKSLTPQQAPENSAGSVMVVLATDAPLDSRQLERLCVRAAAGLVRTGAVFTHGSGDFVIAFSTANQGKPELLHQAGKVSDQDVSDLMNGLFRGVVECVEESVINSLTCAQTIEGRDGHIAPAIPIDRLVVLLEQAGIPRQLKPDRN